MNGAQTFMKQDLGGGSDTVSKFLSSLVVQCRWRWRWRLWLDSYGGQWHQICQHLIKDAAYLYFHSSYLHTGEMEREVPALIEVCRPMTTPCLHACTSDVFFSGFFFFTFNTMFFLYHSPTELHSMWLCLTKLNFLALIYHILAPPGTSGWNLSHTNTCCYTKTERWK